MRDHVDRFAAVGTAALLLFVTPSIVLASPAELPHFRVDELAPGTYAVIQNDPLGLANHANSVFIVGDKDVIVVDTQFTLARTREVLAALRAITDKPVAMVINTHWHDDHTFGNQVYKEAFPNCEFVAHVHTQTDMKTVGVENRKGQVAGGPSALASLRECIDTNVAIDGTPLSEDERVAYESTIAIAQEYLDEQSQFKLTLPTKTFDKSQTLPWGGRNIEIRYWGPAVTRGDIAVYLPKEGVLVAGDLFDNPVSFAYGCNLDGWLSALGSVSGMPQKITVPGHGEPVETVTIALGSMQLFGIKQQAAEAVARGETLDVFRTNVKPIPLESKNEMLQYLFQNYFVIPAATSAFREASEDDE